MRISYVRIENFRNFRLLDVKTGQNIVLIGENKAGKSNFIHALRLVLDPTLSEAERQLSEYDFWDGDEPFKGREIKIVLQLTDFADDPNPDYLPLSFLSGPCLIQTEPIKIAQLTFVYRNTKQLDEPEKSGIDDYEPLIYPGNNPDQPYNTIRELRKNIPIQLIEAIRDIATDNRVWRRSPLRQLVELSDLKIDQLEPYADQVKAVSDKVLAIDPLKNLETDIQSRLEGMVGELYAVSPELGLNATTAAALQEELRLFSDGEKHRPLERTSLGMQNTLYLALLSLLMERQEIKRAQKNERFLPIIALEEPEAHLHPHLQRLVFHDFLDRAFKRKQPVIISSHSPHLVSAAKVEDIVLLKESKANGCVARSAFEFIQELDDRSRKDLERFLDVTKSEMLFSKGTIFVEGDVEFLLIGEFAQILAKPLDKYGISVCNVYGAQFRHVVTLASRFDIPFVVFTDGDKYQKYNGLIRGIDLIKNIDYDLFEQLKLAYVDGNNDWVESRLKQNGIFLNDWTFEKSLLDAGFGEELMKVFVELGEEINVNIKAGVEHIDGYLKNGTDGNIQKVLRSIDDARWGKGRFGHRLLTQIRNKSNSFKLQNEKDAIVPTYIKEGINFLISKVESARARL